eukprot:5852187-Amphidinium_carterae.1
MAFGLNRLKVAIIMVGRTHPTIIDVAELVLEQWFMLCAKSTTVRALQMSAVPACIFCAALCPMKCMNKCVTIQTKTFANLCKETSWIDRSHDNRRRCPPPFLLEFLGTHLGHSAFL